MSVSMAHQIISASSQITPPPSPRVITQDGYNIRGEDEHGAAHVGIGGSQSGSEHVECDSEASGINKHEHEHEHDDPRPLMPRATVLRLTVASHVRSLCIRIVANKFFGPLVMVIVLLNVLILAVAEPKFPDSHIRRQLMLRSETPFTVLYIFEALIKVVAGGMGLRSRERRIYRGVYLASGWNLFDATLVALSAVGFFALRIPRGFVALRGMRGLRLLRFSEEFGRLFRHLGASFRAVLPALLLVLFLTLVVAPISQEVIDDSALEHRCVVDGATTTGRDGDGVVLLDDSQLTCAVEDAGYGRACLPGSTCMRLTDRVHRVYGGVMGFDNPLRTIATSFQIISGDEWEVVQTVLLYSQPPVIAVYPSLVNLVGGQLVAGVALAAVITGYSSSVRAERASEDPVVQKLVRKEKVQRAKEDLLFHSWLTSKTVVDKFPEWPRRRWIRNWCLRVARTAALKRVIISVILFSTVSLAWDGPYISETREQYLEVINAVCVYTFLAEMILKLTAVGWRPYCGSFLLLDGVLTIVGLVELVVASVGGTSVDAIRLLRVMRVVRVIRAMVAVPALKQVLLGILRCIKAISTLFILNVLVTVLLAIAAMHLLGDLGEPPTSVTRFDDVLISFVVVWRVFTGQYWQPLADLAPITGYWIAGVILPIYFIGAYILFNIFLAILLNSFPDDESAQQVMGETHEGDDTEDVGDRGPVLSLLEFARQRLHAERELVLSQEEDAVGCDVDSDMEMGEVHSLASPQCSPITGRMPMAGIPPVHDGESGGGQSPRGRMVRNGPQRGSSPIPGRTGSMRKFMKNLSSKQLVLTGDHADKAKEIGDREKAYNQKYRESLSPMAPAVLQAYPKLLCSRAW